MPNDLKAEIQKLRKLLLTERVANAARASGAWPGAVDMLSLRAASHFAPELEYSDPPSAREVESWVKGMRLDPKTSYLFRGEAEPEKEKTRLTVNPWKRETRSLTQQAEIFRGDRELARRLAREAGVRVTW